MHSLIVFSSLYMMKSENLYSVETLEVGWRGRHTIDPVSIFAQTLTFSTYFSSISPSLARHISRCSASSKTKTALKQFSSQLPQRLKTTKAPLPLYTLTHPSFLITILFACVFSLLCTYTNISNKRQLHIVYVDLNELMIHWECLCSAKKNHPALSPPSSSPISILSLSVPSLASFLSLPSLGLFSKSDTNIKIPQ